MRPLDHGADHDARAAGLARHLDHRRVADGERGALAEHRRKGLGVAAGGGEIELQAVLLEDAGMLADIEVNVAEVMDGLDEVDLLDLGRGGTGRGDEEGSGNRGAEPRGMEASDGTRHDMLPVWSLKTLSNDGVVGLCGRNVCPGDGRKRLTPVPMRSAETVECCLNAAGAVRHVRRGEAHLDAA